MTADNSSSSDQPVMWSYAINNKGFGPATCEQILNLLQSFHRANVRVWRKGMPHWVPVSAVPDFAAAVAPLPVPQDLSAVWFYAIDNKRFGPVTRERVLAVLESGQGDGMTVWREEMIEWMLVSNVSEFSGATVPSTVMPHRIIPDFDPRELPQVHQLRVAKRISVMLFVVFLLSIAPWIAVYVVSASLGDPAPVRPGDMACIGWVLLASVLFVMLYFPLHWGIIISQPTAYKILGLYGAFGLICLLLIELSWVAGFFLA